MAPMGIGALAEPDGRLSQRAVDYYTVRAKGGVGLIVTGITCVDVDIEKKVENGLGMLARIDNPFHISRLSELVDAVHDHGAGLCVQLTAGMGRVAYGDLLRKGRVVAPSAVSCFWDPRVKATALETEEVEALVDAFGRAAVFLRIAGVDAVQLHGHEGYLLDQFQSKLWNHRTDKYGGSLEDRLRFPIEIINTLKARLGSDFPVIYRYGLTHYIKGGREIDEALEMARRFEAAGVDALEVDAGCYETWYWAHPPVYQPPGCMVNLAEQVKKVVGVPVIAVGKLNDPELAEQVLRDGGADFISLGRAFLADPEWPRKVKTGQWGDIRPCIGDHTGCLGRIFSGKTLSCTVNPAAGNEKALKLRQTPRPKSVLVVGGGPAGLETAIVASRRGHRVTLWEKEAKLGGNLIPAAVPEFKKDLRTFTRYLSRQVKASNVDVELCKEANAALIQEMSPDAVILATGADSISLDIPGIGEKNVLNGIEALLADQEWGKKVMVIGGGLVGCEVSVYLSQRGADVHLVEMRTHIAQGENTANRQQLLKLISDENIQVSTHTTVSRIVPTGVVMEKGATRNEEKVDIIIAAVGFRARSALCESLKDIVPELYAVGDCVEPRGIIDAIWEGFRKASIL